MYAIVVSGFQGYIEIMYFWIHKLIYLLNLIVFGDVWLIYIVLQEAKETWMVKDSSQCFHRTKTGRVHIRFLVVLAVLVRRYRFVV